MNSTNLEKEFGFGNIKSLGDALGNLVGPGFMIAGLAVTIYFIIGALRFLTSGGDKNAIEGARGMITHAIIGFILLILLFVIIKFIPEFLGLKDFRII